MTRLVLASFNLFSGRSRADGSIDASRLAEAVASLGADVLAMQEVDRLQPRSGLTDQAEVAATGLGAPAGPGHLRYVATVAGTPGEPGWVPAARSMPDGERGTPALPPPDGPSYGVALASRLPVARWHVLHLDPPRGRYPLPVPSRPPRLLMLPDEPRAAVAAVLDHPQITVACTHLSFVPGVNIAQLRRVRRWLARLPGPVVLLGDLNLPARMAARISGGRPLVTGPTFPAGGPRIQLDHALALGPLPAGSTVRGWVRALPVGDHAAVLAELDLADSGRA